MKAAVLAPSTGSLQPSKFALDIARIKKLPQGEDEPLPCSAAVRVTCLELPDYAATTDVQKGTNNPYYNTTIERELDPAAPELLSFLVEVVEYARASKPMTIFFAKFDVNQAAASSANSKTELNLILTAANPYEDAALAQQQLEKAAELGPDAPTVVLRYRLTAPKFVKPVVDPNADVVLDVLPQLTGNQRLVPRVSPLAWVSLVSDTMWCEKLSQVCVETWKGIPSLAIQIKRMSVAAGLDSVPGPKKPAGKGGATPRGNSAGAEKPGGLKTMSDVVFQAWYCKRSHQLLTRLRLTGEKFVAGEDLGFTLEEESQWKRTWKERSCLRVMQCRRCFESSGSTDKLRAMLDRLWMLMAAGIPADGPSPNLSFEVRHKLGQAQFPTSSCETLLACLCQRLAPWLSFQECEMLSKDDADPRTLPSCVRAAAFPPPVADPKLAPQITFVDIIASFIGRIVDTLTDAEFASALEYLIPAVREAHLRCSGNPAGAVAEASGRGGSAGKKRSGSAKGKKAKAAAKTDDASSPVKDEEVAGDGVTIKHLDKLGRRVDEPKFA